MKYFDSDRFEITKEEAQSILDKGGKVFDADRFEIDRTDLNNPDAIAIEKDGTDFFITPKDEVLANQIGSFKTNNPNITREEVWEKLAGNTPMPETFDFNKTETNEGRFKRVNQGLVNQGVPEILAPPLQSIMPRLSSSMANNGVPDLMSIGTLKNMALGGLDASSFMGRGANSALGMLSGKDFGQSMSNISPTSTNPVVAMGESILMNPLTPFGGGLTSMGKSLGGRLAGSSAPAQFIGKNLGVGGLTTGAEDAQRRLSGQEGVTPIEGALGMAIPFAGAGVSKMLSGKSINAPISANSSYSDLFTQAKTQLTNPKNPNPSFTDIDELATKMFNKTSDVKTSTRSNIEVIPTQKDAIEINDNVNALRESGGSLNLWDKFGSDFFTKFKQANNDRLEAIGSKIGEVDRQYLGSSDIPAKDVLGVWGNSLKKKLGFDLIENDEGKFIVTPTTSAKLMTDQSSEVNQLQRFTDEILRRQKQGSISDNDLRAMEKALRSEIDPSLAKESIKQVDMMVNSLHSDVRNMVKDRVYESANTQKTDELMSQGMPVDRAQNEAKRFADDVIEGYNKDRKEYAKLKQLDQAVENATGKELEFSDEISNADKSFQRGGTALNRVTSQVGDQFTKYIVPYAKEWLGVDLPKEVAKIKASYKLANTELSKKSGGFIGNFKNSPIEAIMEAIKRETNLTPEYLAKMIKNPRKDFDPNKNTLMGLTSKAVEKTTPIGSLIGANVQKSQEDAKKNKSKLQGKN